MILFSFEEAPAEMSSIASTSELLGITTQEASEVRSILAGLSATRVHDLNLITSKVVRFFCKFIAEFSSITSITSHLKPYFFDVLDHDNKISKIHKVLRTKLLRDYATEMNLPHSLEQSDYEKLGLLLKVKPSKNPTFPVDIFNLFVRLQLIHSGGRQMGAAILNACSLNISYLIVNRCCDVVRSELAKRFLASTDPHLLYAEPVVINSIETEAPVCGGDSEHVLVEDAQEESGHPEHSHLQE